jgi:O-antigen ligase
MLNNWRQKQPVLGSALIKPMFLVGLAVVWFGLSALWTSAPLSYAVHAWLKHAKLLIIPLLLLVLMHRETVRLAMQTFVGAQGVVILLSWLLFAGIPLPTLTLTNELGPVIFATSYIDQAAMFAVASALAWHLRHEKLWPKWVSYMLPLFGLSNILFLLPGRTGYVMVVVLVALAFWWLLPKRIRWYSVIVIPMTLLVAELLIPSQSRIGIEKVADEVSRYATKADTSTSAGWRLNAWRTSLQAIAARPVQGYGVGSFVPAVTAFQSANGDSVFGASLSSNPHQEFLLWGVELGAGGVLLLLVLLVGISRSVGAQYVATRHATVSVVVVVLVACLFNSALFDDLMGDFLCFSLGLCLAFGYTRDSDTTNRQNA